MRIALLASVTIMVFAGAVRADAPAPSPEKVAKAWLDPVIAGGEIAAPSKAQPLDFVMNSDAKSCRKTKGVGRATDAKAARQVATCIADSWKKVTAMEPADPENDQWKTGLPWKSVEDAASVADGFPTRAQAKKVVESQKGATVVRTSYHGEMEMLDVWIAVGPDGRVRAVWIQIISLD